MTDSCVGVRFGHAGRGVEFLFEDGPPVVVPPALTVLSTQDSTLGSPTYGGPIFRVEACRVPEGGIIPEGADWRRRFVVMLGSSMAAREGVIERLEAFLAEVPK